MAFANIQSQPDSANKGEQAQSANLQTNAQQHGVTTAEAQFEIVTPQWQYEDTDHFNHTYILPVKEQRRMGTSRGKKSTPQAPAIEIRVKGLGERPLSVQADLWDYGKATDGRNNRIDPQRGIEAGERLVKLRENVFISCTDNVTSFGPVCDDGFRYAVMRCYITRGARVRCRKHHIALRLSVVEGIQSEDCTPVKQVLPIRTARLSISEKAMCPRECDRRKKERNVIKRKLSARGLGSLEQHNTVHSKAHAAAVIKQKQKPKKAVQQQAPVKGQVAKSTKTLLDIASQSKPLQRTTIVDQSILSPAAMLTNMNNPGELLRVGKGALDYQSLYNSQQFTKRRMLNNGASAPFVDPAQYIQPLPTRAGQQYNYDTLLNNQYLLLGRNQMTTTSSMCFFPSSNGLGFPMSTPSPPPVQSIGTIASYSPQQDRKLSNALQNVPTESIVSALKQLKSFPEIVQHLK